MLYLYAIAVIVGSFAMRRNAEMVAVLVGY